jgi:hypothetical protein
MEKCLELDGRSQRYQLLYYNFWVHPSTLRVNAAMEAMIADHVWSLEEIVELIDQ